MPLPNLIHPINCTLQVLDTANTIFDPDAREPLQASERLADVIVQGQPRWVSQKQLEAAGFGPSDAVRGYVLFRFIDLTNAIPPIALKINDRITLQGSLADEVYIVRLEPTAHYPDQGGASMVKAWFTDRQPAKER